MEDEDLVEFLALASSAPSRSGGASSSSDAVVEHASVAPGLSSGAEGQLDDEVAELLQLAAIAAPKKRAFERQSPELMAHARRQLERNRHAAALEGERAKRRKAELQLAVVAASDPGAQLMLGASARKQLPKEIAASIVVKFACLPRIRSALFEKLRKRQTKALAIVSFCLRAGRDAHWHRLAFASSARPQGGAQRVLMFSVQWDETAQRFRASRPETVGGKPTAKTTGAPLAAQVMVISGRMLGINMLGDGVSDDPYFASTLVVAETSANILAEGLIRSLPFAFEDPEAMQALAFRSEFVVFSMTVDRASSNLTVARWAASTCVGLPSNILPWCEFCGAHGVALVKTKAPMVKDLAVALCSFTHWMRYARNVDVLSTEVRHQISARLQIRREPCTEEFRAPGMRLIRLLYGGTDTSALWRWDRRQERWAKTPLLIDLLELCSVSTFAGDDAPWVHHCFVAEGSVEALAGRAVGGPCCASVQESVDKVAEKVLNLCAGRAWQIAKVQRWTNVGSVCRRFAMLAATGNVLIKSLRAVKTHWGLSEGLEASLRRMVEADAGEFSGQNKLRLLKIVQGFSSPDVGAHLAICMATTAALDKLLSSILGGGAGSPRVTLGELAHPISSPIVVCQRFLAGLLFEFRPETAAAEGSEEQAWLLFGVLGGRSTDEQHRLQARRAVLQLSAAVVDYFELRMQQPPYRLFWLIYHDISEQAFDVGWEGLPLNHG